MVRLGPVEVAAVDDGAADLRRVAVHVRVVGGSRCRAEFERAAESTGVANVLSMMNGTPCLCAIFAGFFNVEHDARGVCDGLAEERALVFGRNALEISSGASGSTNVTSMRISSS